MATRERRQGILLGPEAQAPEARQYRFAELETGATLAALNDAL